MKRIAYMTILAAAFSLAACTVEQDDFFDDSSANRADASIQNCYSVLTGAPNGWRVKYFPSKEQSYGGFNFVMQFDEKGYLTCSGDADISGDITAKATSLYKIYQSSGVTLTFDTYNAIFSKMSDPKVVITGETGTGMGGDNEFGVLSACKDSVVLKGRASGNRVVMYPMAEGEEWSAYLGKLADVDNHMYAKSYSLVAKVKDTVRVNNRDSVYERIDTTTFYTDLRGLSYYYISGNDRQVGTASYIITPEGMEFYKSIDYKGHRISGFKYNAATKEFESFDNPEVKLVVDPLNRQFVNSLWFTSKENVGTWTQKNWKLWDKQAKTNCLWKKEDFGLDEDIDLNGEVTLVGVGRISDYFGLYYYVYQEHLYDAFAGIIYLTTELVGDDQIKFKLTNEGSGDTDILLGRGYKYATRPFANATFTVSSDNQMRTSCDLKCNTRSNNDMHFTTQSIAYPLRDPADRPSFDE